MFEVPGAPKGLQNRPGVASRGFVKRAKVASCVFGRVASRKVAPKCRNPAQLSAPRVESSPKVYQSGLECVRSPLSLYIDIHIHMHIIYIYICVHINSYMYVYGHVRHKWLERLLWVPQRDPSATPKKSHFNHPRRLLWRALGSRPNNSGHRTTSGP